MKIKKSFQMPPRSFNICSIAEDFRKYLSLLIYTTESKSSVGNPNFLSNDCPLADCNDTKKNFAFLSLLIMKLTNLLHRLQYPSNNKIFSLLIIVPVCFHFI